MVREKVVADLCDESLANEGVGSPTIVSVVDMLDGTDLQIHLAEGQGLGGIAGDMVRQLCYNLDSALCASDHPRILYLELRVVGDVLRPP